MLAIGGTEGAMNEQEIFVRDGAIVIRDMLSVDELACLRRGVEDNRLRPSALAIVNEDPGRAGRVLEDFRNWQRIPEYETFIRQSGLGAIAGELLETQQVRLFASWETMSGTRLAPIGPALRSPSWTACWRAEPRWTTQFSRSSGPRRPFPTESVHRTGRLSQMLATVSLGLAGGKLLAERQKGDGTTSLGTLVRPPPNV
jgi:hypothetical protein